MPTLCEVFAGTPADGAATGFMLAQLPEQGPVLWVQDRPSRREGGRPYAAGLAGLLGRPVELLWLEVRRPVDVLWAMEEALGCHVLAAVVGEVWGDPSALDFTATKRLALRAEQGGVQAWLLRRAATADLSAARERWRVAALPSPPEPHDLRAPGEPIWRVQLFRARGQLPGEWVARVERSRFPPAHHAPLQSRAMPWAKSGGVP
jgi:protein ImuA